MRRPRAAPSRRTRFCWPTYPSTWRRRAPSASRCRSFQPGWPLKPTKCPLCADKYYTSRTMLEHLAWHTVHAAAPAEDKKAPSHILQVRAARSLWHAPFAECPPPQAASHAAAPKEEEKASDAAREPAVQPIRGPSLRECPPFGLPCERAPHTPWPGHTPGTWLPQRNVGMPARHS